MSAKPITVTATIVLFILAWQMIVLVTKAPEYLLPGPLEVWSYIASNWRGLAFHLSTTFLEAAAGLLVALFAAFGTASLMTVIRSAKEIAFPIIVGMQAVPVVAVAPVLSLWMGVGLASKITMAALLCWFPMIVNAIRGFEATTQEQRSLFTIYGATRVQIFAKLQVPQSMRFLLAGARTSAGLAMIGAIVAEYTGASFGLGYLIMQSTYQLDTPELFATILAAAMSGLVLSAIIGVVEHLFFRRFVRA